MNPVEIKAEKLYLDQAKEGDPGWAELLSATRQSWLDRANSFFASCAGLCGKKVEEPEKAGWQNLPITNRWRCWACTRELEAAGKDHHETDAGRTA